MKLPDFMLSEPIAFHAPALASWMQRRETIEERVKAAANVVLGPEQQRFSLDDLVNARRPYQVTEDGIAVIHANDLLTRDATKWDLMFGETHYNQLISEFQEAADDATVRGIFLDVSSPGGSAVGAPEAAQAVADARAQKPVVSHIEQLGASAAYYVAAGSTAIFASRSAVVGSIGTISMFASMENRIRESGLDVKIITPRASDLKAAGNRYQDMTWDEEKFLRERAETLNADFIAFVKTNRLIAGAEVQDDALRGQWFSGQEAARNGLVDFVGSREDAMRNLRSLCDYQR